VGDAFTNGSVPIGGLRFGQDRETDDELRERFVLAIKSLVRGTYVAVYQAILSIPGIRSLTLLENTPMIGFIQLHVDDGSSNTTVSSALRQLIDDQLFEWKAAGIGYRAYMLDKVFADVVVNVRVSRTAVPATVEAAVESLLSQSLGLYALGQVLEPSKLVDLAFNVPGVESVEVVSPLEPVEVQAQQVFRPRSVTANARI
jgi:uncharacterized phage protein gp47/JayE